MGANKVKTLLLNPKVNFLVVFLRSRKELSIAAGATDVLLFQEYEKAQACILESASGQLKDLSLVVDQVIYFLPTGLAISSAV